MRTKLIIITVLASGFFAITCSCGKTLRSSDAENENLWVSVSLSAKQVKKTRIITEKLRKKSVDRYIYCTGSLEVPPTSHAQVTIPYGGIVKTLYVNTGDYIKAGALLSRVEHPDYLKMQQEYLEKKNQLNFYHEEFKRQGELTIENASSIKKMQQAEVNYRVTEVTLLALKEQLKIIGINADSLHIENISPAINLYAPISGYITVNGVMPGSYLAAGSALCEIMNTQAAYINLQLPEQHAPKVRPGQEVAYSLPNDTSILYHTNIQSTGHQIDPAKKMLDVFASLLDPQMQYLPGMTVHATIKIDPDSAYLIPLKGVLSTESTDYIFMYSDGVITRIPVISGLLYNGMVEIINPDTTFINKAFVVNGTERLNALFD